VQHLDRTRAGTADLAKHHARAGLAKLRLGRDRSELFAAEMPFRAGVGPGREELAERDIEPGEDLLQRGDRGARAVLLDHPSWRCDSRRLSRSSFSRAPVSNSMPCLHLQFCIPG